MSDRLDKALSFAESIKEHIQKSSILKDYITPLYDTYSICNIPNTIMLTFGININSKRPPLQPADVIKEHIEGVRKLVLIVIDSLGYLQLLDYITYDERSVVRELINRGVFLPITSTFPSTTSTGLTSLSTGLTPQEHGIIGYTMYVKVLGLVANMISFAPAVDHRRDIMLDWGIDLRKFLGVSTIYEKLSNEEVQSYILIRNHLTNTALSKMLHAGAEVCGFVNYSDFFITLRKLLEGRPNKDTCIFAYWEAYDTISHIYGPETEEARGELKTFFNTLKSELLEKLNPKVARRTALIITGDHGQAAISQRSVTMVSKHPKLMKNLRIPPTGDSRASYLFSESGKIEWVKDYIQKKLKGKVDLFDSKWLMRKGFFGSNQYRPDFKERIGDLTLISRDDHAFVYPYKGHEEYTLKGAHGGLSPEEALVTFICTRLAGR
ncbi:MAG: alkaline phosphatase family protein [Nitrososphaerota archaeon]|nr:alkaline phosphatase family protein [Nitrososphaerota archaeon]